MKTVRFSEVVKSSGKPDAHLLLIAPGKDKTLQAAIKSNRVMTVYQESGSTKSDYGTIGFVEGSSRQFLVFPQTLKPFADKRVIGIKYDLLESMPVSKGETKPKSGQASKPTPDIAATEVDNLRPGRPKGNLSDDLFDDASSDDRTMATRSAKSETSSDERAMANRERSRNSSDEAPSGERTMATRSAKSEASSDERAMANRERSRNKADKPGDEQPNAAPKSLADVLAKSTGATTSKKKPSAGVQPQDKKSAPAEKVVEFPKPESNQQRSDRSEEVDELKRRVREAIEVLEQGKQVAAYNLLKRIVED